ncbi:hypothetical protein OHC33_008530 [Knufia fluminis]|uniref:Alpha box domain-containing protein n=1 Tax=Knufia fluminis TaxID=191047 RepID=A0AAN8EMV6_9EURO|nr:hypothetical protein OHC33_008530 [Knufia fluminis]
MSANGYLKDKLVIFKQFESTLSDEQRHLLLQNPDLLSPDVVSAFYQASLDNVAQERTSATKASAISSTKRHVQSPMKKPRKVVNSWMAFRSYYSSLINDLPQKVRSPMLAMLWKNDVDHGLWELLSAAFSYIRDNHSEDSVSLEQFLGVATQVVPIIPADQYLARTGWARVGDTLHRVTVCSKEGSKTTNASCAGLARYCFRQGLISRPPTTKQADLKLSRSREPLVSRISFASTASTPLAAAAADQAQLPALPRQSSAINDIELGHIETLENSGLMTFEDRRGDTTDNGPANDGLFATQLGIDSATDSPFSATTPGSDARDIRDTFDSSSFLVDDFWRFAK